MKRREVFALLAGSAAWPLAARAQQGDRMRRVGVLLPGAESDLEARARSAAFRDRLQQLGWADGRNVRIHYRWAEADAGRTQASAAELVAMAPEVILAGNRLTLEAVRKESRAVPIVFIQIPDPVESGLVKSLAHPGGNVTGFINFESSMAGKWLEVLKEMAPAVSRVAVLLHPENPTSVGYRRVVEAAAPSSGLQFVAAPAHGASDIERTIVEFAQSPYGGLIVLPSSLTTLHQKLIVALTARHRLPAVYPYRYFAVGGGLISYGINPSELHRQAASYVDRILRGEKPADLPVQAPTKFELIINLKTAKGMGLEVPPTLLVRADEVIE